MKLSKADAALMSRLFGPELALDDRDVAAFAAEELEIAKSVEFSGEDTEPALCILLANIVHSGIGDGQGAGWSIRPTGDRTALSVHRIKPFAVAA